MSAEAGTRAAAKLALETAHEVAGGLEGATESEAAAALEMSRTLTGYSTAHALLAIEARLGELVDIQRAKFHRQIVGTGTEPDELWDMDDIVRKAFGLAANGGA